MRTGTDAQPSFRPVRTGRRSPSPGRRPVLAAGQPGREAVVAAAVAAGAVLVVGMWWADTPPSSVHGAGGWATSAGRVTGLLGTYLVVVGVLLMGRVAWLDRLIGMDRLAVWHHRNGEYSLSLLAAHALLIIWGYALTEHRNVVGESGSVVLSYPDVLAATVGLLLLVAIGVLSARAVRRRVSYQTWYFVHLYAYLALALSYAHQFATGADFATHPVNRAFWILLYAGVGGLVFTYRVAKPVRDNFRHRLRVADVVPETADTWSVYVVGRELDRMAAQPGQFFLWRFLDRRGWWQAHPYSLSQAPNGRWLRLTVKGLGDHSRDIATLRPGTAVVAEGPYGNLTVERRRLQKVLLIGGGIGITPLRALFESLPGRGGDITLIYRARRVEELVFKEELDDIAARRGARVLYLVGERRRYPAYLTARHLRSVVPDVAEHDVYLCGPPSLLASLERVLRRLGVPRRQVHIEKFEL